MPLLAFLLPNLPIPSSSSVSVSELNIVECKLQVLGAFPVQKKKKKFLSWYFLLGKLFSKGRQSGTDRSQ